MMKLDSSGTSTLKFARTDAWIKHGLYVWVAWTIISLLQITTNRYMLHWIKSHQVLHTLFGLTSLSLTLYGGAIAFQARRMTVVVDVHPIMGMISSTLALLLTLGGFTALMTRQCCKNEWKTARVLFLARIHKYFAYFLILWTQAAITTGLFIYHIRIRALP